MTGQTPLLIVELDYVSTLGLLQFCLNKHCFSAIQSFELGSACALFSDPTCPHHPGEICECHLITLNVYRDDIGTNPLVLHGHDNQTEIWNVNSQPLPLALDECLKYAVREEQYLKGMMGSSEAS